MSLLQAEKYPGQRTAGAAAAAAITVERLVRRFDDVTAVDGVDLEIRRGRDLRLPRAERRRASRPRCGCCAPCWPRPRGGRSWPGYDVATQPAVRLRIGVALQDAALDPKQTGIELLRLQGRLYGLSRAEIDRRLAELGELIDIGDALDRPIGTYSGGMKRRLDLAAALVHNPRSCSWTSRPPASTRRAGHGSGRRSPAEPAARHDHLPDHAVPGGGGRAGRPGRHHRRRAARRRGHPPSSSERRHRCHRRPGRRRGRAAAGVVGPWPACAAWRCAARSFGHQPPTARRRSGRWPSRWPRRDARARPDPAHADARRRVPRADRKPHRTPDVARARPGTMQTASARPRGGHAMTTHEHTTAAPRDQPRSRPPARPVRDLTSIAGRALRAVPRDRRRWSRRCSSPCSSSW